KRLCGTGAEPRDQLMAVFRQPFSVGNSQRFRLGCNRRRTARPRFRHGIKYRYGVIEGAQDAGQIAPGVRLSPSFVETAYRLAFKIGEMAIPLRNQDLAQMQVAMNADAQQPV